MKSSYHLTQGHNPPQTSPSHCRIHRQGSDAFLNIAIMLQNSKQEWPPAAMVHYRLHKPMDKRTSVPRGWSWLRHSDSQSCPFFSPLLVRAPCPSQVPECSPPPPSKSVQGAVGHKPDFMTPPTYPDLHFTATPHTHRAQDFTLCLIGLAVLTKR